MTTTTVRLHDRAVGPDHPCLVIAEAGINHNGDLAMAHDLIEAAADAGAGACKFQNYRTEDFVSDRSLTYEYHSGGTTVTEPMFDMFKRCELDPGSLTELREHCEQRGLVFLSTPTSADGVRALVDAGAHALKNGSDYLTNLPLIQAMAASGLPTILSTGMSQLGEIDDAVQAFRDGGGKELVVLHCTSAYPTPPHEANLRKIPTLAATFGCPIGFSDHTAGTVAATTAVALGACVIEKHFTLDRALPGPDHWFSSDPAELKALVDGVHTVSAQLGSGVIGPTATETASRRDFRLSCVTATDLPAGHTLTEADIAFRRPGTGVPPKGRPWLVGRTLRAALPLGTVLRPDHFEG